MHTHPIITCIIVVANTIQVIANNSCTTGIFVQHEWGGGGGAITICCGMHIIRMKGYDFSPFLSALMCIEIECSTITNCLVWFKQACYITYFNLGVSSDGNINTFPCYHSLLKSKCWGNLVINILVYTTHALGFERNSN